MNLFYPPTMFTYLVNFTIFSIVLASTEVQSYEISVPLSKEKVLWLVEDKIENIDLLIKNSPETSTASYIENLVIQHLPQYDIEIERVTATRINRTLSNTDNTCVANRANTQQRRQYSLFSDPQSFYLTHKLYRFNQKSALPSELLNREGEIRDLASVFTALPTKTIGIAKDISFGSFLDQQIKNIKPENIYYRGGNQRVAALSSMLYTSRVDFVLALPVDITPNNAQKNLLEQYNIAEAPPYLIAHFNCSNSPLGQRLINDINNVLAQLYQTTDYYQAHKQWFSDKQLTDLQIFLAEKFPENRYIITTKSH